MDAQGALHVQGIGSVSLINVIDVASRLKVESCPRVSTPKPAAADYYVTLRTMRYDDLTAAEQLVQGEEEKERIRYIVNRLAQQTMRGSVSAHWWLPLDSISYTGLDAALEDEAEKLYVSAAAYVSRQQSVANYFTVELTVLKEMSQGLADLFGLTLPVSCKKQAQKTTGYQPIPESHLTTLSGGCIGTSS